VLLATEGPLPWAASRGTQQKADLATDRSFVKRDGSQAEAWPVCEGETAGRQELRRGRSALGTLIMIRKRRSTLMKMKAL
jgi:hypothetical protein